MTKMINRRAVLAGAGKLTVAAAAGAVPMAAEAAVASLASDEHPDAALERLWREWLMQLGVLREQAQVYHDASLAFDAARDTVPQVWIVDAEERRTRGQKGPFRVHEYRETKPGRHPDPLSRTAEWRVQPYPGAKSYKAALAMAAEREQRDEAAREAEMEESLDHIEWGNMVEEDRRLRTIEAQIADTPAHTLFGVAVKAGSARQMYWDAPYGHLMARPETVARAKFDFVAYGAALRAGRAS